MSIKVQNNQMADKWYENSKYNICTDFLLPILSLKDIITDSYENCYYYDTNYPYIEDKIMLVYNMDIHDDEYINVHSKLINSPYFYSKYNYYDNGNKEKYIFTVPPIRKRDYKLIIEGRYSQISETYKQQILSYWKLTSNSRIGGILYKRCYQNEDNRFVLNEKGELLDSPSSCIIQEYNTDNIDINISKIKRLRVNTQPFLLLVYKSN